MINPKVRAAAIDFIKSQNIEKISDVSSQSFHDAYEAECRLFNEHFKGFSREEMNDYKAFVSWLDGFEMWKSDLSVDELYKCFVDDMMMHDYDILMEAYQDSIDEEEM